MYLISPLVRIEDAKVERLLRSDHTISNLDITGQKKPEETWTQLALQSACLCVYDSCLIPTGKRTKECMEGIALRRWTNRNYRFHSNEHFLQVRHQVISHLQNFLMQVPCNNTIMVRYETFTVYVEELDMELEQRFHLIWSNDNGAYTVQKLLIDDHEDSLELYRHMTTVFTVSAFGRLPDRIEAWMPIDGNRIVWHPNESTLRDSMDYMRLVKSMLLQQEQSDLVDEAGCLVM